MKDEVIVGRKYDTGKLRYSLIPVLALAEIVKVLCFGANKYGDNNWIHVENASQRYLDALMRHVESYRSGEMLDPESGLHHLAHAGCCILFLLHLNITK
jgi:hypothetical protein